MPKKRYTPEEIVIEVGGVTSTRYRSHESLGYKPPAPEVFVPAFAASATAN